jgi:hypothetical protein
LAGIKQILHRYSISSAKLESPDLHDFVLQPMEPDAGVDDLTDTLM